MQDRRSLAAAAARYDSEKYPEEFYLHHLRVLRDARGVDTGSINAVLYLFAWKLGRLTTSASTHAEALSYFDSKGCRYYCKQPTAANMQALNKATDRERLEAGINFRDGTTTYEAFRQIAGTITCTSIVLPAFYVHIWRPDEYPILDQRVWKAYLYEGGRRVAKHSKPTGWDHYESYTRFFLSLVAETGLSPRDVDQGLWVIGKDVAPGTCRLRHCAGPAPLPTAMGHSPDWPGSPKPPMIPDILNRACGIVSKKGAQLPFRHRGIKITRELIRATMEALNAVSCRTLPQNCHQVRREETPDGLDRRIKDRLQTDLRTANIISDVLADAGIVEVVTVMNTTTGREVKGTRLRDEWSW